MADMKLWCFGESGNSFKVALTLELCGLKWQPVFVDFFNGETRGEKYRAEVNVMGEAPVLEHKGQRLAQSAVILDYLAAETGRFGWHGESQRREILRWMFFDNHKFTANIATLRFLVNFTKDPNADVVKFLTGRVNGAMKVLDAHLASHTFVAGDAPTIADLSLCGYLYYGTELPFAVAPHVQAWADRIKALPGWKHPYDLMPRAFKL